MKSKIEIADTLSSETDARGYGALALRASYFIFDFAGVETEAMWTAAEGAEASVSIAANAIAALPTSMLKEISPFVLVGYGVSNAIPFAQNLQPRLSQKLNIGFLNLGGGMRVFLTDNVALRLEYRYQRYVYNYDLPPVGGEPVHAKRIETLNNVYVGTAFFLNTK